MRNISILRSQAAPCSCGTFQKVVAFLKQDVVRRYKETHTSFDAFAEKVAFQLNDTHPTIGVAELMRLLMDENQLGWTQAWELTCKVRRMANGRR